MLSQSEECCIDPLGATGEGCVLYTAEARLSTSPLLVITQLPQLLEHQLHTNYLLGFCPVRVYVPHTPAGSVVRPPPTQSNPKPPTDTDTSSLSTPPLLIHTHTCNCFTCCYPSQIPLHSSPVTCHLFFFRVLPLTNPDLFLTQLVQTQPCVWPLSFHFQASWL